MESTLRTIRKMHLAMSLSLAVTALAIYVIVDKYGPLGNFEANQLTMEFSGLVAVFVFTALGMILMKRDMRRTQAVDDLGDKMEIYKKASFKLYATIEVSFMAVTILYAVSGLTNLYLYSLLTFVYLLYHRPHPLKLINDMKLSDEHKSEVRKAFQ